MAADLIIFKDVSFSYAPESTAVIQDLSFSVNEKEHVALHGESGAGKTTLFRLLLGFEQPDNGEIIYKGDHLNEEIIQKIRKQTAWLPQDLNLGADTVESLVTFPFGFKTNYHKKPATDQIIEIFKCLGLPASSLGKRFADLSTGQRQRVGIAICYLLDKPLILLDEPTSALDIASKEKVAALLFENADKTILSTSHDPWWMDRCDRVLKI